MNRADLDFVVNQLHLATILSHLSLKFPSKRSTTTLLLRSVPNWKSQRLLSPLQPRFNPMPIKRLKNSSRMSKLPLPAYQRLPRKPQVRMDRMQQRVLAAPKRIRNRLQYSRDDLGISFVLRCYRDPKYLGYRRRSMTRRKQARKYIILPLWSR